MTSPGLLISNLSVQLGRRLVVDDLSLQLESGQLVGLIGPNGAGKTSLLRAIAGLLPHDGQVNWAGRDILTLPPRDRARIMAYVPQDRTIHWPLTVEAMVTLGRHPHRTGLSRARPEDQQVINRVLMECDLTNFRDRPVTELSGGEQARVLLARALAVEAPILLADEPVAALDPKHQMEVMALLQNHVRQADHLGLVILHDLTLAARFCDHFVLLAEGRAVLAGPRDEVFGNAANHSLLEQVYGLPFGFGHHNGLPYVMPVTKD